MRVLLVLIAVLAVAAPADAIPLRTYSGGITNADHAVVESWVGRDALLATYEHSKPAAELRSLDGRRSIRFAASLIGDEAPYAAVLAGGRYVVSGSRALRVVDHAMTHLGPATRVDDDVVGVAASGDRVAVLEADFEGDTQIALYRVVGSRLEPAGRTVKVRSGADEHAAFALGPRGGAWITQSTGHQLTLVRFGSDGHTVARQVIPVLTHDTDLSDLAITPDGRYAIVATGLIDELGVGSPTRAPQLRKVRTPRYNLPIALAVDGTGAHMLAIDGLAPDITATQTTQAWTGRPRSASYALAPAVRRALAASGGGVLDSVAIAPIGGGAVRTSIDVNRAGRVRTFAYASTRSGTVATGGELPVATRAALKLSVLPGLGGPLVAQLPAGGLTPYSASPLEADTPVYGAEVATASTAARLTDGSVVYAGGSAGPTATRHLLTDGRLVPGPALPFPPSLLLAASDGGFWALGDEPGEEDVVHVAADGTPGPVQSVTVPDDETVEPVVAGDQLLLGLAAAVLPRVCLVSVAATGTHTDGDCVQSRGELVAHGAGALLVTPTAAATTALSSDGRVDRAWSARPTGLSAPRVLLGLTPTPDGGFSTLAADGTHYRLVHVSAAGTVAGDRTIVAPAGFSVGAFSAIDGAVVVKSSRNEVGRLFTAADVTG